MISFYKDKEKRVLDPKLFSTTAEQWAKKINESGGGKSNKRTQIRKFYDEVVRYNTLAKVNKEDKKDWDNILPYINMLIAKAAYAKGRNNLVTEDFVGLLKDCVEQIRDPRDLDVFTNFFEAFMGFYRQYGDR
ncbi:MAG: type III-A CRISPR-associated protein Csm2 [Syntrophobacterales bacterium CG03_land_8_20_14_0_80_58_14]|nr:MAG: type III-A CRISPR-associated protein Csm2 [Syntrophaceae bacterium CG2_30_58_14]PIV02686.1 MAG: type III-A CRISPR-associated protein Csm2 [Syntrophobacterales bacterium CG03_land_8_20_14_0_80_58_14]